MRTAYRVTRFDVNAAEDGTQNAPLELPIRITVADYLFPHLNGPGKAQRHHFPKDWRTAIASFQYKEDKKTKRRSQ